MDLEEFEKNQQQFVFESEMNQLQYEVEKVNIIYDEYVTTMSEQLDLPLSMIDKMVCDGKKHIVEEWLEKRIGA